MKNVRAVDLGDEILALPLTTRHVVVSEVYIVHVRGRFNLENMIKVTSG